MDEAESVYGETDCLVNNAGLMLLGNANEQDPAEWDRMIRVNVNGVLNGIGAVIGKMKKRKGGTIINLSSIAGIKGFPNHMAYCGTKFAVHGLSETLREEVADDNVRVITVAPGAVETELLSHTTSSDIREGYESWKDSMGGVIHPEDIASCVNFVYSQPQNVCVREIVVSLHVSSPKPHRVGVLICAGNKKGHYQDDYFEALRRDGSCSRHPVYRANQNKLSRWGSGRVPLLTPRFGPLALDERINPRSVKFSLSGFKRSRSKL